MKFYAETLGCKVNQYETRAMADMLLSRGHTEAADCGGCDVCIINTCAVTGESTRKSRQAVRRLKKRAPDALIAVCGCLSQLEPSGAEKLGADLVGGSGGRLAFIDELEKLVCGGSLQKTVTDNPFDRNIFEEFPSPPPRISALSLRTRALLKIQDGCDNFCAYCIIPYLRGHARSLPVERARGEARKLAEDGFREIVITGIEISSYGKDFRDGTTLLDAAEAISESATGVRLRLGSLSPGAVTEEFCKKLSNIPGLCNHFHLSLQSGCDETLRRMGRQYDTQKVRDSVKLLRRSFIDCGVTADLITGFPGETDEEFAKTLEFVEEMAFSDMHIFPYSQREGTRAAKMPGQVEKSVRRGRAAEAARLSTKMSQAFRCAQIGKTVNVLLERRRDGFWTGHSENYLEVSIKNGGSRNSVHSTQITDFCDGLVWGEIIPAVI